MKDKDKTKAFIARFMEDCRLNQCPFLAKWHFQEMEKINQLPDDPPRKGVKRGQRLPMTKKKMGFMLSQILYPKANIKDYAESANLSYGTVRQWAVEPAFMDKQHKMRHEFADAFIGELKRLLKLDDGMMEAVMLLRELRYYRDIFLLAILQRRIEVLADKLPVFEKWNILLQHTIASLSHDEFGDHKELRKVLEHMFDFERKLTEKQFDEIQEAIKKRDIKAANRRLKVLKDWTTGILREHKEVSLWAYDKKTRKPGPKPKKKK